MPVYWNWQAESMWKAEEKRIAIVVLKKNAEESYITDLNAYDKSPGMEEIYNWQTHRNKDQ